MSNTIPLALQEQLAKITAQSVQASMSPVAAQSAPQQTAPSPEAVAANTQPPAPAPTQLSDGAAQLANTGTPDRPQPTEDWEHKFKVVNGMLKKTAEEKRQLAEQLEEAQRAKPQGNPQVSASSDDVSDDDVERLVKPALLEEFGYDYWRQQIAIQRSMAQANVQQASDPRLETIEEKFYQQEKEAFYRELDGLMPQWQQINGTAPWNAFLGTVEPLTGITFNGLLKDAHDSRDAKRVANIFTTFISKTSSGTGFNAFVTPQQRAPNGQPAQADTITFADWFARMESLLKAGYSPTEFALRQKQLLAMRSEGRVTGVPGETA
jgi:hypothetical protein